MSGYVEKMSKFIDKVLRIGKYKAEWIASLFKHWTRTHANCQKISINASCTRKKTKKSAKFGKDTRESGPNTQPDFMRVAKRPMLGCPRINFKYWKARANRSSEFKL